MEIARREFGLTGEAKQLYSERDANFHLRPADGGPGHVLKIANAVEDPAVVDLQTAGLRHIARADPGLPVPRVVLSRDGEAIAWVELDDGARHMARVYSFLPGEIYWKRCRTSRRCWPISAALPRGSTRRSPASAIPPRRRRSPGTCGCCREWPAMWTISTATGGVRWSGA